MNHTQIYQSFSCNSDGLKFDYRVLWYTEELIVTLMTGYVQKRDGGHTGQSMLNMELPGRRKDEDHREDSWR